MHNIDKFANSSKLPTLPEVALKLVEIAQQDEPDYAEISRIIRSDPVVSGKILKTVNSALFGFRQKIETIEQAIPKLGMTLLRTLILSFHLSRHKTDKETLEPVLQDLWRCSLTQAAFAELIAEQIETVDPPTCFLAAMLQDIGVLAMLCEAPTEYLENVLDRENFPNVAAAERSHFGCSHVDVSVAIIEKWGMAECFGEAIHHHHDKVAGKQAKKTNVLIPILQGASLGANVLFSSRSSAMRLDVTLAQWNDFLKAQFGFSESQVEEMISEVNHRVGEYSSVFKFNIGESVQTEAVVDAAKTMLQEITLKSQMELVAHKTSNRKHNPYAEEMYRDPLSGLYNRRYMNDNFEDLLAPLVKKRKPMVCLFLDVDKFKTINDDNGHSIGDKAIIHVAEWLTKSIRTSDIAIRLGGDEFLVILPNVKELECEKITNRIVNEIPAMEFGKGCSVRVSLSVGCIFYQPVKGDVFDVNWLIDQADHLMYEAKKKGGGSLALQKFVGMEMATA